jgi:hypothetical protein
MYIKEYTFYVDEDDKVIKIVSSEKDWYASHVYRNINCACTMVNLGDRVTLIRVRDQK